MVSEAVFKHKVAKTFLPERDICYYINNTEKFPKKPHT